MKEVFKQFTLKAIDISGKFIMHPMELKDYIDFIVKRIYFITAPQSPTGAHCHKKEKELFVMIQGSCMAEIDRGRGIEEFSMRGPNDAVYVGSYAWHHFKNFSPDAILLAVSSTNYNPNRKDYIENYEDYLKIRDKKLKK